MSSEDGYRSVTHDDRGHVVRITQTGEPMQMPGDGCGCRRWQTMGGTWHLEPCKRHSKELAERE